MMNSTNIFQEIFLQNIANSKNKNHTVSTITFHYISKHAVSYKNFQFNDEFYRKYYYKILQIQK